MARTPRCLIDALRPGRVTLDRATRHHLGRVLRLAPDQPVELVDGRGGLAHGRWLGHGQVQLTHVLRPGAGPAHRRVLAVAPPRPSRLDWLVEKGAELGLDTLVLLASQHAARDVGAVRMERLRRKAGEAMLQCRRLHRMAIEPALQLDVLLADWGGRPIWLACPPGDAPASPPSPPRQDLLMLVGPEGGFSAPETEAARRAGAIPVCLGRGVLRVETAALALAVLAGVDL